MTDQLLAEVKLLVLEDGDDEDKKPKIDGEEESDGEDNEDGLDDEDDKEDEEEEILN